MNKAMNINKDGSPTKKPKSRVIKEKKPKISIKKKKSIQPIHTDTHFCEEHNDLFKKIYIFLNNPKKMHITMHMLNILHHPKAKPIILKQLKMHKKEIHSILDNFRIIMSFYKDNNKILKSEIGHFILYYDYHLSKVHIKKDSDYLNFFYTLLAYPKLFSLLKDIFYILSDYRACLYFASPKIQFHNTHIDIINPIIEKFNTNQNMLFSMISGYYPGSDCPWGSPFYTGAFACYESLFILTKYYSDPFNPLKIEFKYKKQYSHTIILKRMNDLYNIKLNQKQKILNMTQFILFMKKLDYDLYQVIDSIFEMIYEKPTFKNIQDCYILDAKKIYHQKKNYELGVKIYILVSKGYVNTINCFENFRF